MTDISIQKGRVLVLGRNYAVGVSSSEDNRVPCIGSLFDIVRFRGSWRRGEDGRIDDFVLKFTFKEDLLKTLAERGFPKETTSWWYRNGGSRARIPHQRVSYVSPKLGVEILKLFQKQHPDEFRLFVRIAKRAWGLQSRGALFNIYPEDFHREPSLH